MQISRDKDIQVLHAQSAHSIAIRKTSDQEFLEQVIRRES